MGNYIVKECGVADFRVNVRISSQMLREIREITGKFWINMETLIQKINFIINYLYLPFPIRPLKIKFYEPYMSSRNKWIKTASRVIYTPSVP